MDSCNLTYGPMVQNTNQTKVILNFMPQHRSFHIHPLEPNTSYWLTLHCTDNKYQQIYTSRIVFFTTGNEYVVEYIICYL